MRQLKIQTRITDRSSRSVDMYISEISGKEFLPLSANEEAECATLIKEGDLKALDKLVKANLRFVVSVAKQYDNFKTVSLMDLINEGNVGLITAAKKFDHTRGFKFISYAVWWIRQSILKFLNESSRIVQLPLNKLQGLSKINKIAAQLEQNLNRSPSDDEVEDVFVKTEYAIKYNIKSLDNLKSLDQKSLSLDYNMSGNDSEEFTMLDVLSEKADVDEPLDKNSLQIEISRFLTILTYRERKIIEMFYGLNGYNAHSLSQIAEDDHIQLTKERIRQIKAKAERRLKHRSRNSDNLKQFLG